MVFHGSIVLLYADIHKIVKKCAKISSVMAKQWVVSPKYSDNLFEQLLFNRGLKSQEEIEEFFHPKLENYEKDLQIPGTEKAKERILQAIERKELIIVYGDYDVDGICGAAILYLGLTSLGAKVLPYIPHREKEGYGLSKEGLQAAKDQGASLVITVDNGIVALEQAEFAKGLGLDLIITDHHLPKEEFPRCLAKVHSTKICGSAVAWVLIRELIGQEQAEEMLDLVALSTVGDMMPLIGVNRALVTMGLKKLNRTEKIGLKALITQAGLNLGEVTAYHLGHVLVPRLNAKGRLEHSIDTLRLLCTKEVQKAIKLAQMLDEANDQRKQLVTEAVTEAKTMITFDHQKILLLDSPTWIPGVLGLVAGRICEEYRVPTIAISRGETLSKGSARSIGGVNVVETIRQAGDLLIDIGGHPQAAGFTLETAKIEIFRKKLEEIMESVELSREQQLQVEAEVNSSVLTLELAKKLEQLEPTGIDNPKPILATKGMRISDIRTVGNGQHLKFKADGKEAIAFGLGSLAPNIPSGQSVDLAYFLEIDNFNGGHKPQLKVLDLRQNACV